MITRRLALQTIGSIPLLSLPVYDNSIIDSMVIIYKPIPQRVIQATQFCDYNINNDFDLTLKESDKTVRIEYVPVIYTQLSNPCNSFEKSLKDTLDCYISQTKMGLPQLKRMICYHDNQYFTMWNGCWQIKIGLITW